MELNFYICFVAALIPLVIGAVYYHPKVLGGVWMKASGMTPEKTQSGNMALIFGLTYVMGVLIAFSLASLVVHQTSIFSLFVTEPGFGEAGTETMVFFESIMERVGDKHRSFGHGMFHGVFSGLIFATPIIAIIALFERKGFRYVAVHAGYWILTIGLMGGTLAAVL